MLVYILRVVLIVSLIAGGDVALRHPVEGAEDDYGDAASILADLSPALGPQDSVIGIASSGRTPWVLGGVKYARSIGCTSPSRLRLDGDCEAVMEAVVGPEVVTGSTRMKAGTATKLVSLSSYPPLIVDLEHDFEWNNDTHGQDVRQFGESVRLWIGANLRWWT
jgi:N-acetylmuramic acid 6-phosphate (MurNAc-6-P) etherase